MVRNAAGISIRATFTSKKCSQFIRTVAAAAVLTFTSSQVSAQAPLPTVNGNLLIMPVVLVFDTPFYIEWQVVDTDGAIDLLLHDFEVLGGNIITAGAPSFHGEVLNLPRLDLGGSSLWGEFLLDSEEPIIFRLVAAGDNNPGSSGVQGKWRITEETDAVECGEGELIDIYNLQVSQSGNNLTVITDLGNFAATLQGTTLQWNGSYAEDGGTVSNSVNVQFAPSLDSLTGSSSWSYSDGSFSCEGSSVFSGELLHN